MRAARAISLVAALAVALATGRAPAARSFADFPQLGPVQRATLEGPGGERLDVLHYSDGTRRPALVILPGSLCAPIFAAIGDHEAPQVFATATLFTEEQRQAMGVHVAYVERRNIVSLETMAEAREFSIDTIFALSPCTDRNGGVTLEHRVADALVQLRWLDAQPWVSGIHLVGLSEGADVAAAVAVAAVDGGRVDSLMLIGGAGPSQFADAVATARRKADVEALRTAFADLDAFVAGAPPDPYQGYDARRWQSFAIRTSVLEKLRGSTVPLYIAHGDQDRSVPIASADLAAAEIMRLQPGRAVRYRSVTGGDHMLDTATGSRITEVIADYVRWLRDVPQGRSFVAD